MNKGFEDGVLKQAFLLQLKGFIDNKSGWTFFESQAGALLAHWVRTHNSLSDALSLLNEKIGAVHDGEITSEELRVQLVPVQTALAQEVIAWLQQEYLNHAVA